MADDLRAFTSWREVHQAADHHPYVLTFAPVADPLRAYGVDGAVAWFTERAAGTVLVVHGATEACGTLLRLLEARGELAGVVRVIVPRDATDRVPASLKLRTAEDWEFCWTTSAPPALPGEERVQPLDARHHRMINDLLDVSLPDSMARPGGRWIARWYGVLDGGELLACGAQVARGLAPGLGGIAVAPHARGQGLGAALTASLTRRLLSEHRVVGLGVMLDNDTGRRLYRRLGYTRSILRTSCENRVI